MGIGRMLWVSQKIECGAEFMSEVPRTHCRHFHPVGFIPSLWLHSVFPMVEAAKGHRHCEAFISHQCPVALKGPRALYMVYVVGEHENHKVPEGSLISDPPSPGLSHWVVPDVILSSYMKLVSTAILSPA